ncbi:MAG TPA: hypothetical protein VM097_13445 [Mycobacteriales bacterium]|nr:hypothetical protein [Mycobacteriales bacterium]
MIRSPRLLAGILVLALPLAAVAGCGAQKKKTVKQEFSAAQSFLADSKAASFTLRFADAQGNFAKVLTKDGDAPPALVNALLKGSVTYIADPAGDATLKSVQSQAANPTDLKAALDKVNIAFVVRDDKADLLELRLVGGNLYAHLNLKEIGVLAKAGGVEDFDATVDETLGAMDPRFAQGVADVRAGKWLKLPLATYLDQLQELAGGFTGITPPTSAPGKTYDLGGLGDRAYAAVKPYVKVTDANDSSEDRVLDIKVQAAPALKALLGVLKAEKDLPFAPLLADVNPADIDKGVKSGEARGTIRLHESHLTQVAVDLESLRLLATDPGDDSFAGVKVIVDVDDDVDALKAPKELSSLDLGSIIEELLESFSGAMTSSGTVGIAG